MLKSDLLVHSVIVEYPSLGSKQTNNSNNKNERKEKKRKENEWKEGKKKESKPCGAHTSGSSEATFGKVLLMVGIL